jgi:hypothetical protein
MTYTTNQRFKSWKGTKVSIDTSKPALVPRTVFNEVTSNVTNVRRANPIKHYRYQLTTSGSNRSSHIDGTYMNKPGYVNGSRTDPSACCAGDSTSKNIQQLVLNPQSDVIYQRGSYNPTSDKARCGKGCGGQLTDVIKPATTILSKHYSTTNAEYLRRKCKTFKQKTIISQFSDNTYLNAEGELLYPSNNKSGPPEYKMNTCCTVSCNAPTNYPAIYKPNNRQFSQEGAVSSSTRLEKLKLDTINKNAKGFKKDWGSEGANAAKFRGAGTAPYFLKSKNNKCVAGVYHVNGNIVACWGTNNPKPNSEDIVKQSKTTTMVYTRPPKK